MLLPEILEVTGAWIQVVGTLINASGQTVIVLQKNEDSQEGNSLASIGNGVESFGNSLQAIGKTKGSFGKDHDGILGAWLQAAGNITNSYASYLIVRGLEKDGLRLDIVGDSVQSIGAFLEALSLLESDLEDADLASKGDIIQSIGVMIEGIGALYILHDQIEEGIQLQAFGSYAQLTGATLSAIAFTKEIISS